MSNYFSKTILQNKDVAFLLKCALISPTAWRSKGITKALQYPYRNGTNYGFDFEDMYNIRRRSYKKENNFQKQVVLFFNLKGGVGKTATAVQTSFLLSLIGYKVLTIDLDAQQDFSRLIGVDIFSKIKSFHDIYFKDVSPEDVIIKLNHNLHVIPSSTDLLFKTNDELLHKHNKEKRFIELIDKLKPDYDLILIDSHPEASALNKMAIYGSDLIISPVICDEVGFHSIINTSNFLNDFLYDAFDNAPLEEIYKILPTKYQQRKSIHKRYYAEMVFEFSDLLLPKIRESSLYSYAADLYLSIFNIKPGLTKIEEPAEYISAIENNILFGLSTNNSAHEDLYEVTQTILDILRK